MKYRLVGILTIVIAFTLTFVGVALANGPRTYARYHQHEEARSLDDLSPEEQEAASSTSIEPDTFATHLPIVSIQTDGQEIPGRPILDESGDTVYENGVRVETVAEDGSETIPVDVSLYDNENSTPTVANRLSDVPLVETQAEMNIRGHSSAYFDKASYRLTFTLEDRVTANPQEVLGMGVEEDWILNGPFLDKTLMRNYLSMNIFGEILPYTPDVRFVELFLDDTYQGVYLLMETVKVGEDRVEIRKTDNGQTQTSFLVLRDWEGTFGDEQLDEYIEDSMVITDTDIAINYPAAKNLTSAQKEWIQDELNKIERQLYSYDYDETRYGYWNNLDVQSFIDYALVNEYASNYDATRRSTYFYRDLGGRLTAGPLWDFNNAYENILGLDMSKNNQLFLVNMPYYSMLYRDENYVEKTIDRWRELREERLSDERVFGYIDDVAEYLGPAIDRNYEVWGYTMDPEVLPTLTDMQRREPVELNPTSYEEAIANLKDSIAEKASWMDKYIETLRQYSHESAVKPYNH